MKLLVATAGAAPAKEKADYVMSIAKQLQAEILVLHIISENAPLQDGEEALNSFVEAGQRAQVQVSKLLRVGEVVSAIVDCAEAEKASLIIMGASEGKMVAKWLSANVTTSTTIPVVVIPHGLKFGT